MREVQDLHEPFRAYLKRWHIPYIYHRPDKKSGITKGHPDFTILHDGKACCIEFKVAGGKITVEQEQRIMFLQHNGVPTLTTTSLEGAIKYLEAWMKHYHSSFIDPEKAPLAPSEKLYLVAWMNGFIVVRGMDNPQFVRTASQLDLETLPKLPLAVRSTHSAASVRSSE